MELTTKKLLILRMHPWGGMKPSPCCQDTFIAFRVRTLRGISGMINLPQYSLLTVFLIVI